MFTAKSIITIKLYGLESLKDKRSIIKRLINELKTNYNISIIESGQNDSKKFAELGLAFAGDSTDYIISLIDSIEEFIESRDLEIVSNDYEIF